MFWMRGNEGLRFKGHKIEANLVINIFTYFRMSQISQKLLALGKGNPGCSRTQPKIVCCETLWLCSNNLIIVYKMSLQRKYMYQFSKLNLLKTIIKRQKLCYDWWIITGKPNFRNMWSTESSEIGRKYNA